MIQEGNKVDDSSVFKVTEGSTQGELGTEARFYSTTEKKEQIKREFQLYQDKSCVPREGADREY